MARQLGAALRRPILLRQEIYCSIRGRVLFSCVSSSQSSSSRRSTPPTSRTLVHDSLVSSTPNLLALKRFQHLLQTPEHRVLLLTASSSTDTTVRRQLERDTSVFELERRGHGVFGVREFCQLLLRETGRERRVFGRAQLAGLLLYNLDALPSASQLAAVSTLQRRKRVQDLLQLFWLLEREGATPEQCQVVAGENQVAQELAEAYKVYQELLMQHNATSWDGLVMDVLAMCGIQGGEKSLSGGVGEELLRQYTDVVVDDVHRMTPAMTKLVGHLCAQPSVQSSASFSRVLLEGDECPRTQTLEQQLVETAKRINEQHRLSRSLVVVPDKRIPMQNFSQQLLASNNGDKKTTRPPVPLNCWRFGVPEAEEKGVGAFLTQTLLDSEKGKSPSIHVLCPTRADSNRIATAFRKQGLPVRLNDDQFAIALNSMGAPIHLFDESGVNAVYSLLCALCFPSDSRHLYNVLRSDFIGFPPELLSWLMEKEHRSHADLFQVLVEFVKTRGESLFASLQDDAHGYQHPTQKDSKQLRSGLESAESLVALVRQLRAECHKLSAAAIVQRFLEATGRLEVLLSPDTPEQDRESIALADFLRELETVQNIVGSAQVTFVVPYLQQLRDTNLTSSASWEQSVPDEESEIPMGKACVHVLPLTTHSLESLAASTMDHKDSKRVLVLMSMRDSKFPGRMKRLTLPLPLNILSEPFPIQTRAEHLEQCKRLAYQALTLGAYDEVVLSYAELAGTKRESLSRVFKPIWPGEDRLPVAVKGGRSDNKGDRNAVRVTPNAQSRVTTQEPTPAIAQEKAMSLQITPRVWFAEMAEFVREVLNLIAPIWRHEQASQAVAALGKRDPVRQVKRTPSKSEIDQAASLANPGATLKAPARPCAEASSRITYEPPHLSYSQISEYLRCPHRYFLGRVMRLNGDVSTAMMFGHALHEGIAAFARALAAAQQTGSATKETKALASVEAEEAFMRAWAGDGFGLFSSKGQAEFLKDRGLLALWDFIHAHYDDLRLQEIVLVEKEFAIDVPKAKVELRGVWDRIDREDRGDGSSSFVIKEFKSNMGGAERNMRKLADESLQLKMYMYAYRKVFGEAPYGAKLQQIGGIPHGAIVDDPSKTRMRRTSVNEALVLFSEAAVQEAEDAIVEVASGLRRGEFEPKPSFGECAFCPYAGSACHFATDAAIQEARKARG